MALPGVVGFEQIFRGWVEGRGNTTALTFGNDAGRGPFGVARAWYGGVDKQRCGAKANTVIIKD